MTNEQDIKKNLKRIERLEKAVFETADVSVPRSKKPQTLPELARNRTFKNGQQKIAVIVGYHEKIKAMQEIKKENIKQGWKDGKFDGSYSDELLRRSIRDGLVRDLKDGIYDLTQSGEDFFETFLKPQIKYAREN